MSVVVRWRCDVCHDEMTGGEPPHGWTKARDEQGNWRDRCVDCSTPQHVLDALFHLLRRI